MRRPSVWSVVAATAIVVAGGYLLSGLRDSEREPGRRLPIPVPGGVPSSGGEPAAGDAAGRQAEVERLIGVFESRVRNRDDGTDLTVLGELYLISARTTGDPSSYQQAAGVLERALRIGAGNLDARTLLASARLGLHQFGEAEDLAAEVVADDPSRLDAVTILGDARLALGDLAGARLAFLAVDDEIPEAPAIQARLAQLAFLEGDADAAVSLATQAEAGATAGGAGASDVAWFRAFQGALEFELGRYEAAAARYAAALAVDPELPLAVAGLAQVRVAQGRLDESIELYIDANNLTVDPGLVSALGDVYQAAGDDEAAGRLYQTAEAIARETLSSSTVYRRELSLFLSDRELAPIEALELAEAELSVRRDIFAFDTYAWALYQNQRFIEARAAADRALALATPDPHLWFHAGLISAALGDEARAIEELRRALELSPEFHPLQAPLARRVLATLEAGAGAG